MSAAVEQLEQPQDGGAGGAGGGKFLKVALHVIALVPDLARALNITEAAAGWGLVRLHYWTRQQRALLTAPATVPISFLGAFWPGVAVEQLAELLVMLGVGRREGASLVYLPEAEYSRVSNLRAEGGRAAAENLRRGSTPPGATGGSAGHGRPALPQAPSGLAPEGRGGFPPASSRHMPGTSRGDAGAKVTQEERNEKKRSDLVSPEREDLERGKPSLSSKALWERMNETRRALKLRAAPQPEAFAAWHKRALELASEAAILAGYEAFCRSRYWRERACPWSAWAKRWQDFAHEPEAPAAAPSCELCGSLEAAHVWGRVLCHQHAGELTRAQPTDAEPARLEAFAAQWITEQQARA